MLSELFKRNRRLLNASTQDPRRRSFISPAVYATDRVLLPALAAHARGLHSCWTGAFNENAVRELLQLPEHVRPVALLAAGRGMPPLRPVGRMPVEEHVHRETW